MDNVLMKKKGLNIDKSTWRVTRLGELLDDISKRVDNPSQSDYKRFVGLEHLVSGDIKIKNWGATDNLTSSTKAFEAGDILFARRNAYLRRASLVDFDGCCSGDAFVLRENHEKVVPGFMAFFFNSNAVWDFANENAAGTMSQRVKWRDLANYSFLLPPKDQQAQLAELLWAMDEVIETNSSLLFNIRNSKISYFENVIKGEEGKSRPIHKLKDFAKIVRGSSPRPAGDPRFFNGDFLPWVTVGNLTYNDSPYLTIDKITSYLTEEGAKSTRIIPENTVLLSNSGFSLGVPSILTFEAGANDGVAAFLDLKDLKREYLYYFLSSLTTHLREIIAAGADQPNLNTSRIGNIEIPLPSMEEQQDIIELMLQFDSNIEASKKQLLEAKALQKSLINQIF